MRALLIVDLQKDFCPGGALPIQQGDKVVPVINRLLDSFELVLASKDWHPPDTVHFEKWPAHCVRGTEGAAFHSDLDVEKIDKVLVKGTSNIDNGYSAFDASNVDLIRYLKEHQVDDLYIAGLAIEYCVLNTALDAAKAGFTVFVIVDAVAGLSKDKYDLDRALEQMRKNDIHMLFAKDITDKENG